MAMAQWWRDAAAIQMFRCIEPSNRVFVNNLRIVEALLSVPLQTNAVLQHHVRGILLNLNVYNFLQRPN